MALLTQFLDATVRGHNYIILRAKLACVVGAVSIQAFYDMKCHNDLT